MLEVMIKGVWGTREGGLDRKCRSEDGTGEALAKSYLVRAPAI